MAEGVHTVAIHAVALELALIHVVVEEVVHAIAILLSSLVVTTASTRSHKWELLNYRKTYTDSFQQPVLPTSPVLTGIRRRCAAS